MQFKDVLRAVISSKVEQSNPSATKKLDGIYLGLAAFGDSASLATHQILPDRQKSHTPAQQDEEKP